MRFLNSVSVILSALVVALCVPSDLVAQRGRLGGSLVIVLLGIIGGGVLVSMKGVDYGLSALAASIIVAAAVYVFRDPNPPRGGSGGDSSAINFGR